jgi:GMP synthase-like glutamine amidotransferase
MEILCLQHVPFEGPAYLETWLARKGIPLRKLLVPEEPLPDSSHFQAVIVMGGPMNIYQYRDHPWLPEEKAFLHRCLTLGIPMLGICLGAQLIADVLGARVVQNTHREIGWMPIQLTPEIRQEFPTLPDELNVLHWHGDRFALPPGAIRVAQSAACEEQGYYIPDKCLGLQFHMETTSESLNALLTHCADELTLAPYVQDAATIAAGLRAPDFSPWEPLLTSILRI